MANVSPWIKKKPKSHLGIIKEEKDQKGNSFFPREIEREQEKRKFPFSGEEIAAEKWHEFQGKARARILRQSAGKENPYCTDLVWTHLLYLFWSYSSTKTKANRRI